MRVLMCFVCIIALMMLATPQTTAEQQIPGNVTRFSTFHPNDNLFDAEQASFWDTVANTMTTGFSFGITAVVHKTNLQKVGTVFLPMLKGNGPDWSKASVPEMAMALQVGWGLWGQTKNTGKSEANAALIETFRGYYAEAQAASEAREKNTRRELERSKKETQQAKEEQRGDAAHWAAEVQKARTDARRATSDAEKAAEKLESANDLTNECVDAKNELKEKLGSCPEQLKQLNWAKFLAQLFSSAFGLVGWMLMFAMNIVGFVFSFPKLIVYLLFVVYLLFCFFLPAWGAGFTLCAMVCCAYKQHQTNEKTVNTLDLEAKILRLTKELEASKTKYNSTSNLLVQSMQENGALEMKLSQAAQKGKTSQVS